MAKHRTITAGDLKPRHLLRLGASNNYVLVGEAEEVDGQIAVTILGGVDGDQLAEKPTLFFDPNDVVELSNYDITAA